MSNVLQKKGTDGTDPIRDTQLPAAKNRLQTRIGTLCITSSCASSDQTVSLSAAGRIRGQVSHSFIPSPQNQATITSTKRSARRYPTTTTAMTNVCSALSPLRLDRLMG